MSDDKAHFAGPWFWICVRESIEAGLIQEWLRLTGHRLARSDIERMVDEATGYADDVAREYLAHVKQVIYDIVPHPAAPGVTP
ncbi:hypothetical protein [Pseudomonas typographi]|uniref:Uncharacterized protein n=1 Tax=Pseudomonas typographi TaxID=2715964 RepID=A0ABR7YZJ8_9PSED|nr:hypothetical protein [Pseudomonas typographi]MBD1598623.1 hypothetical protein [Pseudomonas typographi]